MSNFLDVLDTDYNGWVELTALAAVQLGLGYGLKYAGVPYRLRSLIASTVVVLAYAAYQTTVDE